MESVWAKAAMGDEGLGDASYGRKTGQLGRDVTTRDCHLSDARLADKDKRYA